MKLEEAIKSSNFKSPLHKAGLNILYTAWWLKTNISAGLKKYGITHEQYNVLRILKGSQPNSLCIGDIGSRMIEKSSNVPRIIDRLESKKMVKRTISETDKRQTWISLTQSGAHILDLATRDMEKIVERQVSLKEDQAVKLNNLLELFREISD